MTEPRSVPEPGALVVGVGGSLAGRTSGYEKRLGDMGGVYRDQAAYEALLAELGGDHVVYRVEEHRCAEGPGALTIGTSTLLPGRVGEEFAVTRGHLHAVPDRAELYHCLSGHGLLLLETLDGRSEAYELAPGRAVHVPGHWVHRSVNTGDEPLVTLFCYNTDAGQDYGLIERAGGMKSLVVADGDGWTLRPNPDHRGYPVEVVA
ncbi:glucose-6-phosphate isomerase [Amycolatopsis sacchari]|uniref:glucose-6-phosphate isomerase n=1 Tax=Amycolatopsis sacchari TaxID=115433 RepID=A0A1I3Q6F1_9PSEU|nr:glucose-6-phosphate isomerase family protein [Amycolatopsis sacchari]SFJ29239.1 glucose-6-phosphate isomerase [Amycolatopsis sacchari]